MNKTFILKTKASLIYQVDRTETSQVMKEIPHLDKIIYPPSKTKPQANSEIP